eukprot:977499-Pyramimonas_sp.AAC.1
MSADDPCEHTSSRNQSMRERQLVTVCSAALIRAAVPRGNVDMGRKWAQLANAKISARDIHCGGRRHILRRAHASLARSTFGVG